MYLLISRDRSYGNAWLVSVNKGYSMSRILIVEQARADSASPGSAGCASGSEAT